jgi:TetR/AcrR family tetracycline transcriptional repressor
MARGALSKQLIVDSALDALDAVGIDGLTLRVVAARLHVQAPALYWHLKSKQDLLDEMGTELWRRVFVRLGDGFGTGRWDLEMRGLAHGIRAELLSHRDGAKVFAGTYLTDPALLERQESGIAALVADGFTVAGVAQSYSLLYSFTIGFCIEEQSVAQAGDDRYSLENRAARVDATENPLVIESGASIFADPDVRFADLVDLVIETVGRIRDRS